MEKSLQNIVFGVYRERNDSFISGSQTMLFINHTQYGNISQVWQTAISVLYEILSKNSYIQCFELYSSKPECQKKGESRQTNGQRKGKNIPVNKYCLP